MMGNPETTYGDEELGPADLETILRHQINLAEQARQVGFFQGLRYSVYVAAGLALVFLLLDVVLAAWLDRISFASLPMAILALVLWRRQRFGLAPTQSQGGPTPTPGPASTASTE